MIDFQFQALSASTFARYFKASPEQLRLANASVPRRKYCDIQSAS